MKHVQKNRYRIHVEKTSLLRRPTSRKFDVTKFTSRKFAVTKLILDKLNSKFASKSKSLWHKFLIKRTLDFNHYILNFHSSKCTLPFNMQMQTCFLVNVGFVVPCIFNHSNKTPNWMQQSVVKFYCFVVQTVFNMFRAL